MRIDGLPQQPQLPHQHQRSTSTRVKKGVDGAGDRVELTAGAAADAQELAEAARAAPAASSARLSELRERVLSAYYDSPQVRQQIAANMLESDTMQTVVSDAAWIRNARQELDGVGDTRSESVQQAGERVRAGYYEDETVRREIAERILDTLT